MPQSLNIHDIVRRTADLFEVIDTNLFCCFACEAPGEGVLQPFNVRLGKGRMPAIEQVKFDGICIPSATLDNGMVGIADLREGVH